MNTNHSKKKEELTPEELWKKVSMQLSIKKHENSKQCQLPSHMDFASFAADIDKITQERLQNVTKEEFMNIELKNSHINTPNFEIFELIYPIKKKKVPAFFPKKPFYVFENPSFYKKFDLDTLFYIFYFCLGTVQQTYAALRLKNYAWRYHLKYKMWFQRLDEPKLITTEYEKGDFLFFDYETSWNFMKKNDFVFEYCYLEHNETF